MGGTIGMVPKISHTSYEPYQNAKSSKLMVLLKLLRLLKFKAWYDISEDVLLHVIFISLKHTSCDSYAY